MTFTTRIKDEITKNVDNTIESRLELLSYLNFTVECDVSKILLVIENASVARYIFKLIKINYNIDISLTIRTQKKFKVKTLYILTIKSKVDKIIQDIEDIKNNIVDLSYEEKYAYLKGAFLSKGSLNDPSKSKYHLEFLCNKESDAILINKLLKSVNFSSKIIRRDKGYMVYIKASEEISDFLKLLQATNCLFYYEDIRIYRDHKNMVNRLNNCEQANIEKSMKTCSVQLENIKYLRDNDLSSLLNEKINIVMEYREKYRETTMSELADIISLETNTNVTKSCINHYFRKIKELVDKHKLNKEN